MTIKEHPERMPRNNYTVFNNYHKFLFYFLIIEIRDITATLDNLANTEHLSQTDHVKKSTKKAKWHLGIRSQSKPQDIMNEVFKAMKSSGMVTQFTLIFYNRIIY